MDTLTSKYQFGRLVYRRQNFILDGAMTARLRIQDDDVMFIGGNCVCKVKDVISFTLMPYPTAVVQ